MARRPLILELVSLVVAVVLGFLVAEWGQDRRERRDGIHAFDRIVLELEANTEALGSVFPYYFEIGSRLDSIIRTDGDEPFGQREIPGWRGVSPPDLRRASYSVALSTGALEHVEFDVADRIALSYEGIDDFDLVFDQAVAASLGGNVVSLRDWLAVFALLGEVSAGAHSDLTCALEVLRRDAPSASVAHEAYDAEALDEACPATEHR